MPVRSKLICDAAELGCRTIDGTRMMLHQACAQIELYTGCATVPIEAMETALLEEITRMS